eukprot:CAMPEP_0202892600 /NCGR_PEP_ID=MMETSP1392-20130828/2307_1 /ASSEMBLY_ACC=CAM_ASM_000868 /TAXON_ID=225041 /ORGANISM="Chlamydomonas chlamydogama, Strain SAG 11-48b" /LENGTH=43 /DNA_ID= /DNA_START= /DNA_END= /DNA_ORIENTATION=
MVKGVMPSGSAKWQEYVGVVGVQATCRRNLMLHNYDPLMAFPM